MEFKEESDLSTCKICSKIKLRRLVGKFDDKNKKYIDENGKLWNGRKCPLCHQKSIKENMKKLRVIRKELDNAKT
jgi:Zn-finger protein